MVYVNFLRDLLYKTINFVRLIGTVVAAPSPKVSTKIKKKTVVVLITFWSVFISSCVSVYQVSTIDIQFYSGVMVDL